MNTGRNFIGFELDSHFYEIAKKELQQLDSKTERSRRFVRTEKISLLRVRK